jgi:biopolymer transport protein ExbD
MRFFNTTISREQPRLLDLVPMVNVVLLLVFFFLLSWSFVLQPGVEVRLPAAGINSVTQQGKHVVTLKMNGSEVMIYFDETYLKRAEFAERLRLVSEKSPGEWITLNADEAVAHGVVQGIAAQIIHHGFRVTLATQAGNSSPSTHVEATLPPGT